MSSSNSFTEFFDREERHLVYLHVRIKQLAAGLELSAIVTDIAHGGCKVECMAPLDPDHRVIIAIPGRSSLEAKIVWTKTGACGCKFTAPLETNVLSQLVKHGNSKATPSNCTEASLSSARRVRKDVAAKTELEELRCQLSVLIEKLDSAIGGANGATLPATKKVKG